MSQEGTDTSHIHLAIGAAKDPTFALMQILIESIEGTENAVDPF